MDKMIFPDNILLWLETVLFLQTIIFSKLKNYECKYIFHEFILKDFQIYS